MKKLGGVMLVLAFLLFGLFSYPQPWNKAMAGMKDKVGFHLPYIPDLPFTLGLDLKGGAHLVYEADMSLIPDGDKSDALAGVRDVVERRVNSFGVAEPLVETTIADGKYRVIVDLPGITNVAEAVKNIGETPVLEFKTPDENPKLDPTAEQQAQIEAAQKTERKAALAVLELALKRGADFAALAKEYSIDPAAGGAGTPQITLEGSGTVTTGNGGDLGFLMSDDSEYGGFISEIEKKRLRTGVVDGLYEGTSRIHIMKYVSRKNVVEPAASHILICYAGATSCQSDRTKEEALKLITDLKGQATKSNFAELAKTNSDDPGSKDGGGELGFVKEGMMVKPFEEALFALKDGQFSDIVTTDFGYHLIYRPKSQTVKAYELAHIEMPWTTASDLIKVDPWKNTALSGKDVKRASVAFDPNTGAPYIVLDFNAEGAKLFGELTSANVGKVIGIFLDGNPVTTPVVNEAIYGGTAQITGAYTLEEAKTTAQRLNAGALPVPIKVVSQQTIGASLGESSLTKSIEAGLVGIILVAIFMLLYYRLPGVMAVLALAFYSVAVLAFFKAFHVTMTLSGIAGFVFSLGIAVDANVLVFERLKEELWSGRDLPSAVTEAFHRAWPSIRDGNLTTLIATLVLYSMSTGFIRGFALTLTIGVLVSMFSSMVVTKFFMVRVAKFKKLRTRLFYRGYKSVKAVK
ncbi:MAG: protein translocase subunit SecD [Patescibacteria group bacterium]|jgi:preprotein translocase subunit SecD